MSIFVESSNSKRKGLYCMQSIVITDDVQHFSAWSKKQASVINKNSFNLQYFLSLSLHYINYTTESIFAVAIFTFP
jgi:hypothetical protein